METIKDAIISARPHLSKQSVSTYTSILKNLYEKIFGKENFSLDNFSNTEEILKFLNTLPPNKRKTILSALVILTDSKPYRQQMLEDINSYNKQQRTQEMSESQKNSWVATDDIKKLLAVLEREVKLLYKKETLTNSDLQTIQNYIIICLLGGIYIPPRRSKDYVDFKIKNINKSSDNFFNKNKFIFNSYKTAKTYGQQDLIIPDDLQKIIRKWIKINPTEYLLFDNNGNKLSNVKLNQRLNKLFGNKKVGVNQLRHTYLSDKYQDTIKTNNEMAQDLNNMGSSIIQEKIYIKKKNSL